MKNIAWIVMMAAAPAVSGCGKPPAGQNGPPAEYSVNAVIAEAAVDTVRSTVELVGSLKARNVIDIVSEINGTIREIHFTEGAEIREGALLARLDDAKIRARADEAKARFNLAETNYQRASELFRNQTISEQEYDQARAEFDVAEAVHKLLAEELADTEIRAPFTGSVSDRRVSPGQYVTAGQVITRLVQMTPLEAEFRVPEAHIGRLAAGQEIRMYSAALGEAITGRLFFIDPLVDSHTRTVLAKAEVSNKDGRLKPGLFGSLSLVLAERNNAVVIPESCVRYSGDQASIVVMNRENRAEFRDVTVGVRMPGRVEITTGLAPGERVVVEGFQKMGPGTMITISPDSARYGVMPSGPTG